VPQCPTAVDVKDYDYLTASSSETFHLPCRYTSPLEGQLVPASLTGLYTDDSDHKKSADCKRRQ